MEIFSDANIIIVVKFDSQYQMKKTRLMKRIEINTGLLIIEMIREYNPDFKKINQM